MPNPDPYLADLVRRFLAVVPKGKVSQAARAMDMKVSTLHAILRGESDAGAENRAKIARYLVAHEPVTKLDAPITDSEVDSVQTAEQTTPLAVTPPPVNLSPEGIPVPSLEYKTVYMMLAGLSGPAFLAAKAYITKLWMEKDHPAELAPEPRKVVRGNQ